MKIRNETRRELGIKENSKKRKINGITVKKMKMKVNKYKKKHSKLYPSVDEKKIKKGGLRCILGEKEMKRNSKLREVISQEKEERARKLIRPLILKDKI